MVKFLVSKGADVNAGDGYGKTALILASANYYTDIGKYLVSIKGININARDAMNRTAIMYAKDNKTIRNILLKAGAKVGLKD